MMARDHFLEWGRAPHNPYEGKDRPAFNQAAYARYLRGEVDANGDPLPDRHYQELREGGTVAPRDPPA